MDLFETFRCSLESLRDELLPGAELETIRQDGMWVAHLLLNGQRMSMAVDEASVLPQHVTAEHLRPHVKRAASKMAA